MNATITATTLIREDDQRAHIEDDRCYSAIRGGKLLTGLTWNELTDEEQRAARAVIFDLYNYNY